MTHRFKSPTPRSLACSLATALAIGFVSPIANAAFTNDRAYLFGDDGGEAGVAGQPAGVDFDGNRFTFDTVGETDAGNFQDMEVINGPLYADVTARPFAGSSTVGISFDGVDDYLAAASLNLPETSPASVVSGGPENYEGLANRGFQFWVNPDSAAQNDGLAQSLVLDTNEHGVRITADDTWAMRYAGEDFDTGIPVAFDAWYHVMLVRPFGAANGARMYLNGVAVAFGPGGYDGANIEDLVVGANTALDEEDNFTGGTEEFFTGVMDDLTMFVLGDNSDSTLNPPGQDWGTFQIETDNEFIAASLTGIAGDVNQDGVLDDDDVTDFITGWDSRRIINEMELGDLVSLANGDLNFDGHVDLFDAIILDNALIVQGGEGLNFTALPEPTSLALLGIGGLALLRRRRVRNTIAPGAMLLAGALVISNADTNAHAQTLFDESYTGTELFALPDGATAPSGRTLELTGSRLDFLDEGADANDIMYRLPLASAGSAGPLDFLRLTFTADTQQLTDDNDFAIAISDGTNIIGYQNGDSTNNGTSWHFGATDDGASYSEADFTAFGITNDEVFTVTINLNTGPGSSRLTTNQAGESVTNNVSRLFDVTQPLSLLVLGDEADEIYGINTLSATLEIVAPSEPILRIDRDSGEMQLRNDSDGPISLKGYTIASATGSLDASSWLTIAENYDAGSPGPNQADPDDDWTKLSGNDAQEELSEFQFGGDGATLAPGQSINLGNGPWVRSNVEDLTLLYASGGEVREGFVQFVGNDNQPFAFLDLNFDGDITAEDWAIFSAGQHTDLSELSLAAAYQAGDLNGDLTNDFFDFRIFKDTFDALNGEGAFVTMLATIPEPGSLALLSLAGAFVLRRRANTSL